MALITYDLEQKIKVRKERIAELSKEIVAKQDTIRVLTKEIEEFEKMTKVLKP